MKIIYTIILLLLMSIQARACDCIWGGNFIRSSKYSEVIVKAKVVEMFWHFDNGKTFDNDIEAYDYLIASDTEYYKSIKIHVIELIKGNEKRRYFELYGTDGVDCRESISKFKIDHTYILGMYKSPKDGNDQHNEDSDDYAIGGCSEKWLEYSAKTNLVKGYITGKKRRRMKPYSYDKLLSKIR